MSDETPGSDFDVWTQPGHQESSFDSDSGSQPGRTKSSHQKLLLGVFGVGSGRCHVIKLDAILDM